MNHLAHLLLAGPEEGDRLGALLGDHIKGRSALEELPAPVIRGVRLHRFIDGFTDRHPAGVELLTSLQPPFRRYGGVILDILFDHMLDRHWRRFSDVPLTRFADEVNALFARRREVLPARLRRFLGWADATGLWTRYGEEEMLEEIFTRTAARHGRPSPLGRGVEILRERDADIEVAFLKMFPELMVQAAEFRRRFQPSEHK